jgi:hypothetical protein
MAVPPDDLLLELLANLEAVCANEQDEEHQEAESEGKKDARVGREANQVNNLRFVEPTVVQDAQDGAACKCKQENALARDGEKVVLGVTEGVELGCRDENHE